MARLPCSPATVKRQNTRLVGPLVYIRGIFYIVTYESNFQVLDQMKTLSSRSEYSLASYTT